MSSPTTGKFVSPFIDGEDTQVLNTLSDFQLNMDDSLVEDFFPEPSKPSLNDSLCGEDVVLPAEEATVPLQDTCSPAMDSAADDDETQLVEDPSAGDMTKASLNDSLCGDTQLPTEQPDLPVKSAESSILDTKSTNEEASSVLANCLETQDDDSTEANVDDAMSISSPVTTTSAANETVKSSSINEHNKQGGSKVKPAFGKKKKFFVPPTSKAVSPQSTPDENATTAATGNKGIIGSKKAAFSTPAKTKSNDKGSDQTSDSASEEIPAPTKPSFFAKKKSKGESADTGSSKPATKKPKAPCKESNLADTDSQSPGAVDKENQPPESAAKQLKKTKAAALKDVKKSRPVDPKKVTAKEEKERKQLEREKAKQVKEEAKREKERLKEEKKLEQERKKAEREQKKIERELMKVEKLQSKADKKTSKCKSGEVAKPENEAQSEVSNAQGDSTATSPATHDTTSEPANKDNTESTSTPDPVDMVGPASSSEVENVTTEHNNAPGIETHSPPPRSIKTEDVKEDKGGCTNNEGELQKESDSDSTASVKDTVKGSNEEIGKTNADSKQQEVPQPKKRPLASSDNTSTKMKTFKPAFKVDRPCESTKKASKQSKKRTLPSDSDAPSAKKLKAESKESTSKANKSSTKPKPRKQKSTSTKEPTKPSNYSGPVWVQCEDCEKWRRLSSIADPSLVPEHWTCSINKDSEHAQCSSPEEVWSDLGDSQEFVESPFIPGSLVWAKMDCYPWWPAMIEEDPDEEAYYEMGRSSNNVPVRYHVVFLDTPVCRAWVTSSHIQGFTDSVDPNEEHRVSVAKKYRKTLKMATKCASKATGISFKERLERFSFAQRFTMNKRSSRKRKATSDDEDSQEDKTIKRMRTSVAGKRKSVCLENKPLTEQSNTPDHIVEADENTCTGKDREDSYTNTPEPTDTSKDQEAGIEEVGTTSENLKTDTPDPQSLLKAEE